MRTNALSPDQPLPHPCLANIRIRSPLSSPSALCDLPVLLGRPGHLALTPTPLPCVPAPLRASHASSQCPERQTRTRSLQRKRYLSVAGLWPCSHLPSRRSLGTQNFSLDFPEPSHMGYQCSRAQLLPVPEARELVGPTMRDVLFFLKKEKYEG